MGGRFVQDFLSGAIGPVIGLIRQRQNIGRRFCPKVQRHFIGKRLHGLDGFIHVRFFVAGKSLLFKRFLYFGFLPIEVVGILPLTAVVFFMGERSLRRVPCAHSSSCLIAVHFVDGLNSLFLVERRIEIGVNVASLIHL